MKKFKTLDLPCDIVEGKVIDANKLTPADLKSLDSLFTYSSPWLCYGMLPDTSRFFTLIFYAPTVTYTPVVSTFSKAGYEISRQDIDFGCWDGAPYDYSCDGHLTVDKEMNLNLEHVTTCNDCDSTSSKPIKYIDKRKGKIKSDGQIELEPKKS